MLGTRERMGELLKAAASHADYVLERAADRSGRTPLFANALDAGSGEQVRHDYDHVDGTALLSSPASQMNWLRTLAALTNLTGRPAYKDAAEAVLRHLLRERTDRNGLIYWGGHTAYDLERQMTAFASDKARVHELKCHYPDYELMWQVDPAGTKRYIEAVWNAHILDWGRLDFNRHGAYDAPYTPLWTSAYSGGDVFFWGGGLTFVNAGSDLIYSAAMLAHLSGEEAPLVWSRRLAERYAETRRSGVGISGYQFSQSAAAWCDGPAVRGDRAQYQLAPLIPDGHLVYESTLFKPRPAVQRCLLAVGGALGEKGDLFRRQACEEMAAWGRTAYRKADNSFIPMLTDGFSLEGLVLDRNGYFGRKGTVFRAMPARSDYFWMYAMGYRLSGDPFLWEMTRDIAAGIGAGEIGGTDSDKPVIPAAEAGKAVADHRVLYGMLELYKATGGRRFIDAAYRLAEGILAERFRKGRFVAGGSVLTDDPAPLALLHLAAAGSDRSGLLPCAFRS